MSRPLILESERLVLRPFREADRETFAAYRSDPEVARYQSWETPYTYNQAADMIAALMRTHPGAPGEWYQLAIDLKESGEFIGDTAFQVLARDPQQGEIGFTLARPYWGQGYASEAAASLVNFLFEELHLHRVRANCDADNPASARVMERVGMRREGHFVESLWFKGRYVDEVWYAILRREWLERQSGDGAAFFRLNDHSH